MRGRNWSQAKATTTLGTSGPVRVVSDQPDESVQLRSAGFTGITTALIRGDITPPRRLQIRRLGIWWHWDCPCCSEHVGGFCPDWQAAYDAARLHAGVAHG